MGNIVSGRFPEPESVDANTGMIAAIGKWCEALQGTVPLRTAIEEIAVATGAEAAILSQIGRKSGTGTRPIIFDRHSDMAPGDRIDHAFAESVLGRYRSSARPGTVWYSSSVEFELDPRLAYLQEHRRLADLAVIPLGLSDTSVDVLELHFAHRHDRPMQTMLGMFAATLARTWATRRSDIFATRLLARDLAPELRSAPPILSVANPKRLSRAEYRVCLLLSRGLNTRNLCEELAISTATMRSHLRSIYAKCEVSGQSELLFQLLTPADRPLRRPDERRNFA